MRGARQLRKRMYRRKHLIEYAKAHGLGDKRNGNLIISEIEFR